MGLAGDKQGDRDRVELLLGARQRLDEHERGINANRVGEPVLLGLLQALEDEHHERGRLWARDDLVGRNGLRVLLGRPLDIAGADKSGDPLRIGLALAEPQRDAQRLRVGVVFGHIELAAERVRRAI